METDNQKFGQIGEQLAREYYLKNNYTLLETNWRSKHLEVDIIASTADKIIFCEVKARSSDLFKAPENSVTIQKQRNLIRAANYYIAKYNITKEVQFDIISVLKKGEEVTVTYIPDAFMPQW